MVNQSYMKKLKDIDNLIELIDIELMSLINEDGGHISRSPVLQIHC